MNNLINTTLVLGLFNLVACNPQTPSASNTSVELSEAQKASRKMSVSLVGPSNSQVFTAPATVTYEVMAADGQFGIVEVAFYLNDSLVATKTSLPYNHTLINLSAGTYSLYAKAKNDRGATKNSNIVGIKVNAPASPNIPPSVQITSPVSNSSFNAPANFILSASASDADGTISKVEFYKGETVLCTDSSAPYNCSLSNLAAGNYTFTAKATDNLGGIKISGIINITVTASVNSLPDVQITSPVSNSSFNAPANFILSASASDSDGTISKVEFYKGETVLCTDSSAPYTCSVSNLAAGNYTFTAKATDNLGATKTSVSTFVRVDSGDPGSYPGGSIPLDRKIDWSLAGVPGGIPSNSWSICKTLSPRGPGLDDSIVIQQALESCGNVNNEPSNGKVVLLTAGSFNIRSYRWIEGDALKGSVSRNNIVLRGAGPDKTTLKIQPGYSGGGTLNLGGGSVWPPYAQSTILPVQSGATRGNDKIMVTGATSSMKGKLMHVSQLNATIPIDTSPQMNIKITGIGNQGTGPDPVADRDRNGNARNLQQIVKITNVVGNEITFSPALYWTYDRSPEVAIVNDTVHQVGIEDLKIDNSLALSNNESAYAAIAFWKVDQCWIRNVEANSFRNGFFIYGSLNCEVRDSYFHHPVANVFRDGSDAGYNQLVQSSATLIQNNIFTDLLAPSVFAATSGTVVGYNFYYRIRAGDITNIMSAINGNHGGHGIFNLFEGNKGNLFQADDYYGSSSHGLIFRNHFIGTDVGVTSRRKPISIDAEQTYYTILGNVLGSDALASWSYEASNAGSVPNGVIYRLGYAAMGNDSGGGHDLKVRASLLRGGNYDYSSRSVIWRTSDFMDSTYLLAFTLPKSLYLGANKPLWFKTTLWPAIGPDVTGGSADTSGHADYIPAERCYQYIKNGNPFNALQCY